MFGKQDSDITSVEMTVTSSDGMDRILIAISEKSREDSDGSNYNSYLAYLDYLTCETLFYVRNADAYQAGLFSVAIYTDDMSSAKRYETIYEVGKAQYHSNQVIVSVIEHSIQGNGFGLRTISFNVDSLVDYGSTDYNDVD